MPSEHGNRWHPIRSGVVPRKWSKLANDSDHHYNLHPLARLIDALHHLRAKTISTQGTLRCQRCRRWKTDKQVNKNYQFFPSMFPSILSISLSVFFAFDGCNDYDNFVDSVDFDDFVNFVNFVDFDDFVNFLKFVDFDDFVKMSILSIFDGVVNFVISRRFRSILVSFVDFTFLSIRTIFFDTTFSILTFSSISCDLKTFLMFLMICVY